MKDIIEQLANNNYVIIGLACLLVFLIILFLVLLFSKKSKITEEDSVLEEKTEENKTYDDINFDAGEYVKETTAEFELTPISELEPAPDEYIPDVNFEESPAIEINQKEVDEVPLADFDFDELSKSISRELDKIKTDDNSEDNMDLFKETGNEFKAVEVTRFDDIKENSINPDEGIIFPNKAENNTEPVLKEEETPLFARFNAETYEINKKD